LRYQRSPPNSKNFPLTRTRGGAKEADRDEELASTEIDDDDDDGAESSNPSGVTTRRITGLRA
jgi:hypothetical protein